MCVTMIVSDMGWFNIENSFIRDWLREYKFTAEVFDKYLENFPNCK